VTRFRVCGVVALDGVLNEEYIHTNTLLGWEWVPTTL